MISLIKILIIVLFVEIRRFEAGGGGILIFYKNSYNIQNLQMDSSFETISFSTLINNRKLTFVSSYNPHFKHSNLYLPHIENKLLDLNLRSEVILIGDLNHDLLTRNGEALVAKMASLNFINYVNKPTRVCKSTQTLLDVFQIV